MRAYEGTFIKRSGEVRTLKFAKINDLPKDFLPEAKGESRALREGMELVWDIENNSYRIFNYSTMVGKLKEFDYKPTM
jgi:hypothetical protein